MNISLDLLMFPFEDENWIVKFLIGGVLGLVAGFGAILILPLVLTFPLYGYMMRIMRRTIQGEEPELPEWDDWGGLFRDGFRGFVVYFVYSLPVTALMCCTYALFFVPFVATLNDPNNMEAAVPLMAAGYAGIFLGLACTFILILPLAFFSAAGISRMVAEDSLGSAFQFGEVWQLVRRGFRNYLMGFIAIFGVLMLAYIVLLALTYTVVLYCVVPFLYGFLIVYFLALMGAIFGKAYYETEGAGGETGAGKEEAAAA